MKALLKTHNSHNHGRHLAGFVTALLLLFTASLATAQDCDLDSVCRSLTEYEATTGSFVMKRNIASVNRELSSSGDFIICGEGIAWNTTKPLQTLLAVTEDKIIQRLPDGSKNIMDGSGNQTFKSIASTLSSLFSGDRAALEENFSVAFSASGSDWTMTLRPKDSSVASVMTSIIMEGSGREETFLNSLVLQEKGGGRISYLFSEQRHRDSLDEHEKAYFSVD